MAEWDIRCLLDKLNDENFEVLKQDVANMRLYFPKVKSDTAVNMLMNVITSKNIYKRIDREQLSKILYGLFAAEFHDLKSICKYVDKKVSDIYIDKKGTSIQRCYDRACAIAKEIRDMMQDSKIKQIPDEALLDLADFVKIMMAIYAACSKNSTNVDFTDLKSVSCIKFWEWKCGNRPGFLGIPVPKTAMSSEENEFGILLTRVIYLWICEMDGIDGGKV